MSLGIVSSQKSTTWPQITAYADLLTTDVYEHARGVERGKECERVGSGWVDVLKGGMKYLVTHSFVDIYTIM